nr:hypothetical protein CKG001_02170 [Bdellovibrio sp. CKG001]
MPPSTAITYEIDGLNRRIAKKVNGTVQKRWVYMDRYRIAAELNSSGAITKRFVWGSKANVPDYLIASGVKYRIISDHLGSPRLVVKQSDGTVIQRMNHDEFGRVTEDTNPGYLPFGFAGGHYDNHTQLVRFGARDYDPETGRWTSKDPILFNGGDTNLFGYVQNDPVNLIDPTGNCPWCIGAVVGGVASGVSAYLAGGDARTVAVSAAVGAVAGAASMGVSAFTSSATGIIAANAVIGGSTSVATQVATGTSISALNYSQIGIGALAGGIGAGVGLGAGTAVFYGTPVIGRSIGVGLARTNEFWASLLTGTAIGTTIEGAGACR